MAPAAQHQSPRRAAAARYGFAALTAGVGVAVMAALLEVSESPVYAPIVAAAAIAVAWGGWRSGLLCVALAWSASLWLFVEPRAALDFADSDGLTRWIANLVAALAIVVLTELLRSRRDRAARAARSAQAIADDMASLQEVAGALSSVATTAEIAHVLVTVLPGVIGARGAAVGLVVGDDLVVLDPSGGALEAHPPGSLLSLALRAPITRATDGETVVVRSRRELEREFPDAVEMTPYGQAAIAAPLCVQGAVAGAMSFVFDRADGISERAEAIVRITADLGGQALERALLYEREIETRQALDRLLRIAPRFHADDPEDVVRAICREARLTFGSDYGVLWRVHDGSLELLASDPGADSLSPGLTVPLGDFPELKQAVGDLGTSFVPDAQAEAREAGLELVRDLGIRSSLRVPITVGGQPELLLSLSFRRVIPEPSPSTILVARRLADHAGLALEQLERKRAEAEARRRAEEARRLHKVTTALSAAATSTDVSAICLEHSLAATGAERGFVVLRTQGRGTDLTALHGLAAEDEEGWRDLAGVLLDAPSPSGGSMRVLAGEEAAIAGSAHRVQLGSLLVLPLGSGAGTTGALVLVFDAEPPSLGEDTERWLRGVVSQCAQALERTRLLDEEQRQRHRAELLQRMTTRLSSALSLADVAEVTVDEAAQAADAAGAALAIAQPGREVMMAIAWRGYPSEAVEPWLELPLDDALPGMAAVRGRRSVLYEGSKPLSAAFGDVAGSLLATGHETFLVVPLVVGRELRGVLLLSWPGSHAVPADQLGLVGALAAQAAQAVDRASHFEWERSVASTLQQSVIPGSLPDVAGVVLAARYLPGTAGLEVGGDWFDAIQLPESRLGLVVGDVVGKGVDAAATMAQLRNALRAFSLERLKPSSALARLNRLAHEILDDPFATAVYAVLDPAKAVCRVATAGHPPPLLAFGDGRAEYLERCRGLPLGADPDSSYTQEVVEMATGAVLLLYTDGLVERRDRPIDEGLRLLREAVAEAPLELEELVDHVIERLVGSGERADDVAVLAVQLLPVAPQPLFLRVPPSTESAKQARHALRTWLTGTALAPSEAEDVVATTVVVRAEAAGDVVRVRVEDDGEWLPPERGRGGGLGLTLMGSLMSSARVARTSRGTKVTLERRVRAG